MCNVQHARSQRLLQRACLRQSQTCKMDCREGNSERGPCRPVPSGGTLYTCCSLPQPASASPPAEVPESSASTFQAQWTGQDGNVRIVCNYHLHVSQFRRGMALRRAFATTVLIKDIHQQFTEENGTVKAKVDWGWVGWRALRFPRCLYRGGGGG